VIVSFFKISAMKTIHRTGTYVNLCLYFIHLLSILDEIWYKGSEVKSLEHL